MPRKNPEERRAYGREYMKKQREDPEKYEEMKLKSREWWNKQSRQEKRSRALRSRYGISLEDLNQMLEDRDYRCDICNVHKPIRLNSKSQQKRQLYIDHNHDTGEVRGLLCPRCNNFISYLENTPSLFYKGLNYLYKHEYKVDEKTSIAMSAFNYIFSGFHLMKHGVKE